MPDAARQPPSSRDARRGNESSVVAFPHTQERPLHNLPLELSSFVGREREIGEVKRLVVEEDKNRLVTLTGPGGCGKTRLAEPPHRRAAPAFDLQQAWCFLPGCGRQTSGRARPNLTPLCPRCRL
jgi:hypothetical protein